MYGSRIQSRQNPARAGTASKAPDGGRLLRRKTGDRDVDTLSRMIRRSGRPAGPRAKIKVGSANDTLEQEADRLADHVVGHSNGPVTTADAASSAAGTSGLPALQRMVPKEEEKKVPAKAEMPQKLPEEEKKAVQRQADPGATPEEEQQLQAKTADKSAPLEEEKVRKKTDDRAPAVKEEEKVPMQRKAKEQVREEEKPLQRQARQPEEPSRSGETGGEDTELDRMLASAGSGGFPLPPDVQTEMEDKTGRRLDSVRIHTDSTAVELCERLNARAFTRGSDIFFDSGRYDPASVEGKRLLAHELAHVFQQGHDTGHNTVRRLKKLEVTKGPPKGNKGSEKKMDLSGTYLNRETHPPELHINKVSLPDLKKRNETKIKPHKPFTVRRGSRDETKQVKNWRNEVRESAKKSVDKKVARAKDRGSMNESGQYFFRARNNERLIVFGDEKALAGCFELPFWDRKGKARSFQVDHIWEDQLGGPDEPSNYELLDAYANMKAGSSLMWEIRRRIAGAVEALKEEHPGAKKIPATPRKIEGADRIRERNQVIFDDIDFKGTKIADAEFWKLEEIKEEDGPHVKMLQTLNKEEMKTLGKRKLFQVFTSASGGEILELPKDEKKQIEKWLPRVSLKRHKINEKAAPDEKAASLTVEVFGEKMKNGLSRGSKLAEENWSVKKIPGIYGGYLDKESISKEIKQSLRLPGLSAVTLDFIELQGKRGFVGHGKVLPSVPFIRDADIEIVIDGDEVQLRKMFNAGEIAVPRPFALTDTTLGVFFSSERGVGVEGRTGFEIEKVGEGFVKAAESTGGGFELEGEFNFDSKLFDPARVKVAYREERFSVSGDIGIPKGKLRGVKRAQIHVGYEDERFSATGDAELDVPGVDRGTLAVEYTPEGWSIGGAFNLKKGIPGIRSGSISATVRKVEGEEGYRVTARGTAVPSLPGIDSELTVEYDQGALTFSAKAAYKRGMLSGQVDLGATNRALDKQGQPTGAPSETFVIYGGGELTMQLTPWLKGTVGVQFQPDGEMVVSGRLGLPSSLEVFGRIGMPDTEIFGIGFDIPIFAIPVGPKSIGLKATIHGGLNAYAGIGPGRLEGLELGIVYNPSREEDTHVTGTGRFVVPAEAGIKLVVRATIGLDVLIGGVEGGLEVAGGLGLQAEASAGISLDWTPASGLELRAELAASVQPKFIFSIKGVIKAWVAWWDKEWSWKLADYEYGSNLRLGVKLPVVYREGEPFQLSYNDLRIERPEIDPSSLLKGLIRDIREHRE